MHDIFCTLRCNAIIHIYFLSIHKFIVQEYKKIRHQEITRGIKSLITLI